MSLKYPQLSSGPHNSRFKMLLVAGTIAGLATLLLFFFARGSTELNPPLAPADSPTNASTENAEPPPPPLPASPIGLLHATLHGPLESAVISATNPQLGPPLTQVIVRTLVWWISVPQHLMRTDELWAVYETRDNAEPLLHAIRFSSRKTGKTHEAFWFHPEGERYARFFLEDGTELEPFLVDGPLEEWEQITSHLNDGRRHQGVDFKVPVGTPVKSPFDGVVVRKNWNFRGNGNALEILETGGKRRCIFLHLNELPSSTRPGQTVRKGQVVAHSGNSGRSFAPHLHYQLMDGNNRVLNPIREHKIIHRKLSGEALAAFEKERERLRQRLEGKTP
ncbi:MAG: M23 family metallopeptidase [Proteobacteria bacterium]|nr:M23 family metallopeptidase [Cystobacterineae bacterium]MCL2259111.1 M23 family metallopeptidase [Cystobacterineae bacterium]MCL2314513.1 M23 family metallopeptidase [Pseudomonadota bacterium]